MLFTGFGLLDSRQLIPLTFFRLTAVQTQAEFMRLFKPFCPFDPGRPVGVATAAGQQHAQIAETDVIDNGETVPGDRLAEGPEEVVGGCH